jgi:hypothetical protein
MRHHHSHSLFVIDLLKRHALLRHSRRWLLGFVALLLGVCAYDRCQTTLWIGATDLEVEIVVTDGTTGKPIEGAKVTCVAEDEIGKQSDEKELALETDAHGIARRVCRDSTCTGARSWLGFTNTFAVRMPSWLVWASAAEFQSSGVIQLNTLDSKRSLRDTARISVQIYLAQKSGSPAR